MLEALLNKVTNLRPATLLKKTSALVVSCEICENFRNYFEEHLQATSPEETPFLEMIEI